MDILFRLRNVYDLYKVQVLLLLKMKEENGISKLVFSYFWRYDWVNACQLRPTCIGKVRFDVLGSKLSNHVFAL